MTETVAPLTLYLALAVGVYMLAAGLVGVFKPARWVTLMDDFRASPALSYMTGVGVFAIGVAIIIAHPFWQGPLAIAVSAIGWVAAIEGVLFIAAPGLLFAIADRMMRPRILKAYAAFAVLVGAVLLLAAVAGVR